MTQIADARRAPVHPGDVALVCVTAVAVICVPIADLVGLGGRWMARYLDSESTYSVALMLLLLGGIVSLPRVGQRVNGRIMLLAALMGSVHSIALGFATFGPLAFVGDAVQFVDSILIGYLLLRWPRSRLQNRAQRVAFVTACILPTGLTILGDLLYSPAAHHWTTPAWWPLLLRNDAAYTALWNLAQWSWAVLLVVFLVLIVHRLVRASGPERRELTPVGIAAALAVVSNTSVIGAGLGLWPDLKAYVF